MRVRRELRAPLALAGAVGVLLALTTACSSHTTAGQFPATTTTVRSAKASPVYDPNLHPPITIPPGGCPQAKGDTVTLTVDDSGITPRCVTVRLSQQLVVVNDGQQFHNVTIQDLSANLDVGDAQPYGRIGRYFIPGMYSIHSQTEPDISLDPGFYGTLVVVK